jgi:hypothetical protein
MKPEDKALELGARDVTHGINWSWANHFPTDEAAAKFVAWLEAEGLETRGVCVADDAYHVRWR